MDFTLFGEAPIRLQWRRMVRLRRCLFFALTLFSGSAAFAESSAEIRAYSIATNALYIKSWDYADKKFGEFVQKFSKSPRVPEAILFQAEARYRLGRYADVMELLSRTQNKAGMWEDEYLYWMAQTCCRSTNYETAVDLFGALIKNFPNSPRRLEVSLAEATALSRLGEWRRATQVLQATNGVFQRAAAANPTNLFVVRGYLLLGEGQLAQKYFVDAEATLDGLSRRTLDRESSWRREYLRCRLLLAKGLAEDALEQTTQLLALAGVPIHPPLTTNSVALPANASPQEMPEPAGMLAESWSFRATVLEQLGHLDDAVAAYEKNLIPTAPVDQQRRALLKIAQLDLARTNSAGAVETLEKYLNEHPHDGAADMALLAMGELQLSQYVAETGVEGATRLQPAVGSGTNGVQRALDRFNALLGTFPGSPLAGKALLDKGWCFWLTGNMAQSDLAFRLAAGRLPFSEDQAVARFKWADAQFMEKDYAGAIANYNLVVDDYASLADVKDRLFELALYQTVRAALAADDLGAATNALRRILDWYPNGFAGTRGLLLVGQSLAQRQDPAGARELFARFEERYPTNALLPEIKMAEARTYEQEQNWSAAIDRYAGWIARFTNHTELPQVEFCRAWDNYMAGRDTNAAVLFGRFVARFPTHKLAPRAQWWIGDYYFGQGDFLNAEKNYQLVYTQFTNWPSSELAYYAQMRAGLTAMARLSYKNAINYFTNLTSNPNCPPELTVQALFAYGDAEINLDSDETNRQTHLNEAIRIFKQIPQIVSTNQFAALAWGRIGNGYLQWAALDPAKYVDASNAYQQVIEAPAASVTARSQARVGLGRVAEGLADLKSGAEPAALYREALGDYLDVFLQQDLPGGEQADLFWVKEAGYKAAHVAEVLQDWPQAIQIYGKMQDLLPQLRLALETKMLKAQKNLELEKR